MAAYPWMPLYVADYISDTVGLTTEEHGAYDLLIFAYWRRGGPLPDDNKYLASVTKTNRQRWARVRKTIEAYFQITDGAWHHKRIDIELLKASGRYVSAKANGRAGGLAKSKLTTITTHNHKEEERRSLSAKTASRVSKNPLNGHQEDFDLFYDAFPKHEAKGAAKRAYAAALKRTDPGQILKGAIRYAQSRHGEDIKYTAQPATWLRADRWLDEGKSREILDPIKSTELKDKADQMLKRGRYAEGSQ